MSLLKSSKNLFLNGEIITDIENSVSSLNRLHIQNIRNTHITLEVLNKDLEVIGRIEGRATSGSISVSSESLIRRTGTITLAMHERLTPRKESLLWMGNRVRVYAGIEDLQSSKQKVTHFLLGTFAIEEPVVDTDATTDTITIQLSDLMSVFDDTFLENKMVFEGDTPVHIAVNSLANYFGEFNTDIEFGLKNIPYKMEYEAGSRVMDVLKDLRDLYMDNECYYDLRGKFIYKHMNIQLSGGEPVKWRFDGDYNLMINTSKSYTYNNVYNRVLVIGGADSVSGISPKDESTVTDINSIFHESSLGRVKTKVVTESSYKNKEQCASRARYEIFKSSNFQEQVNMACVPIYTLDVNDVIQLQKDGDENSFDNYIIDTITIPFDNKSDMSISCHKAYYDSYESELSDSLKVYREAVENIVYGIKNYGWLSVAEKKIKQAFGIGMEEKEVKPTLSVQFQNGDIGGTTAYIAGYTNTKNQTLVIDIADFGKAHGENGAVQDDLKGEYLDRVLAHEMLHAVMNDYVGVNRILVIGEWVKEGLAEFLHGADERMKTVIAPKGELDYEKVKKLSERAVELIKGNPLKSENMDYASAYLAIRYMYYYMKKNNKSMNDLMYQYKTITPYLQNLDKNAISSVVGMSYDEFIEKAEAEMLTFFDTRIVLNVGSDEIDTGSILGSDYTTTYLNAENVIDNSIAEIGVLSYNFEVDIKTI